MYSGAQCFHFEGTLDDNRQLKILTESAFYSMYFFVFIKGNGKNIHKRCHAFREYTELLEEQLQEEMSHRQQLEELNLQLVEQMKQLKQQQLRLWAAGPASSGKGHLFSRRGWIM